MSADEYKSQGNAAFAAKDYQKAVELFSQAIDASAAPNHVLHSNRSAAYASLKQFDLALEDALKTVDINPTWAKGYSRVAAAQYGLDDLDAAEASYSKTLELDPANKMAKDGLAAVESLKNARAAGAAPPGGMPDMGLGRIFNDPNLIEKLKANPKTAEFMKDPALVQKVLQLKANPQAGAQLMMSDPRLLQIMGSLLGIDLNDDSPTDFPTPSASTSSSTPAQPKEETPKEEPKQETPKEETPKTDAEGDVEVEDEIPETASNKEAADAAKAEGNVLYKQRKFDEAIAKYNEAWELNQDVTYLNNRAAAEYEKGDYEQTIATCLEAVEKGRESRTDYKVIAKSLARIGNAYIKLEKFTDAITYFEKSLTEHRTPDVLNKLRSTQKALKDAEAKSYIDPEKAEEARLEGKDYFTKGDWPAAVRAYTEMVKRAPDDARGYSNRAAALAKLMSFPDAIKDCALAIQKDPNFIRAYIRKATAEIAIKDFGSAIKTLEAAQEKDALVNEGKNAREIEQLLYKSYSQRFEAAPNETPEQTMERVSKDPEVASIIQDPVMNSILSQARDNPAALQEHMKNPEVAKKVQILMAAGVIRTR